MELLHMAQGTPGTSSVSEGGLSAPLNPDSAQDAKQGPSYPYGLRITLGPDELQKLGVDEIPSAGRKFHVEAMGVITRSTTSDDDADGDVDSGCLELQITHLAFEHEDEEEPERDHASRMYGSREG